MLRWQGWFNWTKYFFASDNPFLPWSLVINLLLLALHLYIVFWVFKDALKRYRRGAPWAALVAVLPLAGWVVYLLYRVSPLVEFDRIEYQTFDETEEEWTDYDAYKANRNAALFASLKSLGQREEGKGYSEWIRRSRERELKPKLSPAELTARREQRRQSKVERRQAKQQRQLEAKAVRAQRAKFNRERQTMVGAHGFTYKLSDRKQRGLKRKMEMVEQLKLVPREDPALEDLIYDMRYSAALQAAQDGLAVAQEMNDAQGVVTYQAYISRMLEMLSRQNAGD